MPFFGAATTSRIPERAMTNAVMRIVFFLMVLVSVSETNPDRLMLQQTYYRFWGVQSIIGQNLLFG